ncbi:MULTISPECIES: DUF2141 domain-containing protein [Phenylobacterium]|uniref:Uncharacterized protein (DUF2141 family) n=1 Tax=Phenylobacterium koreense TaxID=266125 RepID=A0ABV2EDX2_9CAUL
MKARTGLLTFAATGLLGAGPAFAEACEGSATDVRLHVQVNGVRAAQGQVAVTVYPDEAARFLAPKGKLARVRVSAQAPTTRVCFNLPKAGHYAVAIYHDANGDQDFNRNGLGMPTEGFGFSNDAPTRVGLPPFRSVRFPVVGGDNRITIRMRYLN